MPPMRRRTKFSGPRTKGPQLRDGPSLQGLHNSSFLSKEPCFYLTSANSQVRRDVIYERTQRPHIQRGMIGHYQVVFATQHCR